MRMGPLEFRRRLRRRSTDAERRLWNVLRDRRFGAKFRRQHPAGPYVLDFFCPKLRLAVEADGGQHSEERQAASDRRRDAFLAGQGIKVLRFTDREILLETTTVREVLWRALGEASTSTADRRHPAPLPR